MLEVYSPTFYKIRYILEELYVAVMWILSRLKMYINQLNEALKLLDLRKIFYGRMFDLRKENFWKC